MEYYVFVVSSAKLLSESGSYLNGFVYEFVIFVGGNALEQFSNACNLKATVNKNSYSPNETYNLSRSVHLIKNKFSPDFWHISTYFSTQYSIRFLKFTFENA